MFLSASLIHSTHGAQDIDDNTSLTVIPSQALTSVQKRAFNRCIEHINVASSLFQDTVTYCRTQKEKFDPNNEDNLTLQKIKDVITVTPSYRQDFVKKRYEECRRSYVKKEPLDKRNAYIKEVLQEPYESFSQQETNFAIKAAESQKWVSELEEKAKEGNLKNLRDVFINSLCVSYIVWLGTNWNYLFNGVDPLLQKRFSYYVNYQQNMLKQSANRFFLCFNIIKELYPFFKNEQEIQSYFLYFPILKAALERKWDAQFLELFLMDVLSPQVLERFNDMMEQIKQTNVVVLQKIKLTDQNINLVKISNDFKQKYLEVLRAQDDSLVEEESKKIDALYGEIFAKPKKKRKQKKKTGSVASSTTPHELFDQVVTEVNDSGVAIFIPAEPTVAPVLEPLHEVIVDSEPPQFIWTTKRTKAQKKADKRKRDQEKIAREKATVNIIQDDLEDRYREHHPHVMTDHRFEDLSQTENSMMKNIFNHNASPNLRYEEIEGALKKMGIIIEQRGNGDFRKWILPNGAKVFSFKPPVPQIGKHFLQILRDGLGKKWGVTAQHFEG